MVATCAFCEIAEGATVAALIQRDDLTMSFLDHRPLFEGHVLLIPRPHVTEFAELPSSMVGPFFERAQRLEAAVVKAMHADGSFVAMNNVVSQSVPHLHLHIVPRRRKDGLRGFFWPRTEYESGEAAERTAASIRAVLLGADPPSSA